MVWPGPHPASLCWRGGGGLVCPAWGRGKKHQSPSGAQGYPPTPEENRVSDKGFEVNNILKNKKNLQPTAPTNICPMFTASSIAQQKFMETTQCPSTDEWINEIWPAHTTEYYSAMKRNEILIYVTIWAGASMMAQLVKNPPANAGDARDLGSIPGSGRSPGERNGYPLQYSCRENPMDRGAWQTTVHGVKSQI